MSAFAEFKAMRNDMLKIEEYFMEKQMTYTSTTDKYSKGGPGHKAIENEELRKLSASLKAKSKLPHAHKKKSNPKTAADQIQFKLTEMNNKIDQIENEIKIVVNSKLFVSNPEIRVM